MIHGSLVCSCGTLEAVPSRSEGKWEMTVRCTAVERNQICVCIRTDSPLKHEAKSTVEQHVECHPITSVSRSAVKHPRGQEVLVNPEQPGLPVPQPGTLWAFDKHRV